MGVCCMRPVLLAATMSGEGYSSSQPYLVVLAMDIHKDMDKVIHVFKYDRRERPMQSLPKPATTTTTTTTIAIAIAIATMNRRPALQQPSQKKTDDSGQPQKEEYPINGRPDAPTRRRSGKRKEPSTTRAMTQSAAKRPTPPVVKVFGTLLAIVFSGLYYTSVRGMADSMELWGVDHDGAVTTSTTTHDSITTSSTTKDAGFENILLRAQNHTTACMGLQSEHEFTAFDVRKDVPFQNDTVASLPSFGIKDAITNYYNNNNNNAASSYPTCEMPPAMECGETQLTVVFMAYNPDRLDVTFAQMRNMLSTEYHGLIADIVLVWNGDRDIANSTAGQQVLDYSHDPNTHLRIVYPLKQGLPNDLMNRYHPRVLDTALIHTKALLYYDDDGPFYSYAAIKGGFELWKLHASVQVGAMARQLTYGARQQKEHYQMLATTDDDVWQTDKKPHPDDTQFVSHCTNVQDTVEYQFRFFANYDANMVLPSGSMLHVNYLCYLWHPVFAEIRQFVLDHPVHPDDITVSMIVSQLAGRAPRVYSRRLKPERRRLQQQPNGTLPFEDEESTTINEMTQGLLWKKEVLENQQQRRRKLMFAIDWDNGEGMTEKKQMWADLRTEAVNALVQYFGSLNSGSIGWCDSSSTEPSPYYNAKKDGRCDPVMAKQGWLPWMNSDGTSKTKCP